MDKNIEYNAMEEVLLYMDWAKGPKKILDWDIGDFKDDPIDVQK